MHAQDFFRYSTEPASEAARWLKGLKKQMGTLIYRRKLFGNESLDNSAQEIYLPHVRDICAAFARANTREAAGRKLAVKTLWRCSGRAGEPGKMAWNDLTWNALFDCPIGKAVQPKVQKTKDIPFIAGRDRHADWVIDLADDLALRRGSMSYDSEQKMPLLPELSGDHSGTKLGDYIKGLQPTGAKGSIARYKAVHISTLPPHPTAAGFRPGASDTMALCIPAEFAVHTTGHDLKDLSALWNYLDSRLALRMPGAQNPPQEPPRLLALLDCSARILSVWRRSEPNVAAFGSARMGMDIARPVRDACPLLVRCLLTLTRPSPPP